MFENSNSIQFVFLVEVEDRSDLVFDHKEILDAKWVKLDEVCSLDLRDAEYTKDALSKINNSDTLSLDSIVIR